MQLVLLYRVDMPLNMGYKIHTLSKTFPKTLLICAKGQLALDINGTDIK